MDPLAVAADEGVTAASAPPRCIAPTSTAPTEAASRPSRSISQVTPYLGNRSWLVHLMQTACLLVRPTAWISTGSSPGPTP
jgi:hypothetical protein